MLSVLYSTGDSINYVLFGQACKRGTKMCLMDFAEYMIYLFYYLPHWRVSTPAHYVTETASKL